MSFERLYHFHAPSNWLIPTNFSGDLRSQDLCNAEQGCNSFHIRSYHLNLQTKLFWQISSFRFREKIFCCEENRILCLVVFQPTCGLYWHSIFWPRFEQYIWEVERRSKSRIPRQVWNWSPGVNFINKFTRSSYMLWSLKRKEETDLTVFLALLGSACIKSCSQNVGEINTWSSRPQMTRVSKIFWSLKNVLNVWAILSSNSYPSSVPSIFWSNSFSPGSDLNIYWKQYAY